MVVMINNENCVCLVCFENCELTKGWYTIILDRKLEKNYTMLFDLCVFNKEGSWIEYECSWIEYEWTSMELMQMHRIDDHNWMLGTMHRTDDLCIKSTLLLILQNWWPQLDAQVIISMHFHHDLFPKSKVVKLTNGYGIFNKVTSINTWNCCKTFTDD